MKVWISQYSSPKIYQPEVWNCSETFCQCFQSIGLEVCPQISTQIWTWVREVHTMLTLGGPHSCWPYSPVICPSLAQVRHNSSLSQFCHGLFGPIHCCLVIACALWGVPIRLLLKDTRAPGWFFASGCCCALLLYFSFKVLSATARCQYMPC